MFGFSSYRAKHVIFVIVLAGLCLLCVVVVVVDVLFVGVVVAAIQSIILFWWRLVPMLLKVFSVGLVVFQLKFVFCCNTI